MLKNMAQGQKGKLNYRCPSCFMRDIDIDLFYDKENDEYYCLRCCFTGKEADVLRLNEQARYRYKLINKRVEFSEDNAPIKTTIYRGK